MDKQILQLVRNRFPQIAEKSLQEAIAEVGQIMDFKAGEIIMDYHSYVKMVPLLISGSIKVVREDEEGHELFLYFLEPGQTCSLSFSCCMMQKQSIIRTIAEDDTVLIGIPIKHTDEWMRRYQSWKNFVMRSYDQRMYELIRTIDNIAFKKMDDRLLKYLKEKVKANRSNIISATHQEIAYDLNASREAISRLLKQLEKLGYIKLGRNQVEMLALDG